MSLTRFPTSRMDRENPNARNCGLRSRDINQAAKNALYEKFNAGQIGFKTVADQTTRFTQFSTFIKDHHGVKDMRAITKEHVSQYAQELDSKIDNGSISIKTAHEYLSAVNSVLSQAIGNSSLRVTASEAGLPNRSGIATENRAISQEQHNKITSQFSDRLSAISEMQRSLGLRFEEACKGNPAAMLKEAVIKQSISVTDGTKGGQARTVPIVSQNQLDALQNASVIQGHHHSMIPADQSYIQFQSQSYREFGKLDYKSHGERHAYAQNSYTNHMQQQTAVAGIKSVVESGYKHGSSHHQYIANKVGCTVEQAKAFDNAARLSVAEELGHHRTDITNAYLG